MILQRNILILYNINYHQQFIEIMLQRAFRSHLYPFIRDICCYSLHASFNKAAKQGFHKLGEGGGPDHGPLPVAKY